MTKYISYILINDELTKIEFETDINPVEFLWQRYGMSTYIERITKVEDLKISEE